MSIHRRLKRFHRDETGSVTVEMMLVLPLLVWCFVGIFVFFEAYRIQTVNVKSAYTLGDQLSRETGFVTPAYMDSLYNLHSFLVDTQERKAIRISAYEYEEDDDTFRVIWSQSRGSGSAPRITDARIDDIRSALPDIPDEQIMILTETWVHYEPARYSGLRPFTSYEVVVNRPRNASQICWNSRNNGTVATAVCQAGY